MHLNIGSIRFPRSSLTPLLFALLISGNLLAGEAIFYYAHSDGSVSARTFAQTAECMRQPETAFFGITPSPATGRDFAFDEVTDLMWYSASDNHVHSINVTSSLPGPTINDIDDAVLGSSRTLAIDSHNRRLYISTSLGDVKVYDLTSNTQIDLIPFTSWGQSEPNAGRRRQLAAAKVNGTGTPDGLLWYAAANGEFRQFNPITKTYTGLVIPTSEQFGTDLGQDRYFDIVKFPSAYQLHYAASDGSLRIIDLDTLTDTGLFIPANWFLGDNPGVLRSISVDPNFELQELAPPPPENVAASQGDFGDRVRVWWDHYSGSHSFSLFRRDIGTVNWLHLGNGQIVFDPANGRPFADDTIPDPGVHYEYSVNIWTCGGATSDLSSPPAIGWTSDTIFFDRFE